MNQAEIAALALDTVVTLAEAPEVSLDDLVATRPVSDYVLRRRDRAGVREGLAPLIDDPSAGLRAYLVNLGPGESAVPPTLHKGSELVLVAAGLVQVDLGSATPVMRVGGCGARDEGADHEMDEPPQQAGGPVLGAARLG